MCGLGNAKERQLVGPRQALDACLLAARRGVVGHRYRVYELNWQPARRVATRTAGSMAREPALEIDRPTRVKRAVAAAQQIYPRLGHGSIASPQGRQGPADAPGGNQWSAPWADPSAAAADLLGLLERWRLRVDSRAVGGLRDAVAVDGDDGVGEVGDAVLAHAHRVSERMSSCLRDERRVELATAGRAAESALTSLVGRLVRR